MAQTLVPVESLRILHRTQWLVAATRITTPVKDILDAVKPEEPVYGVWHGTQIHICADGYCETATFGYGDDVRCARCEEFYDPARDDTL